MKNLTKVVLVVVLLAIVLSLVYLQLEIENLAPKQNGTTNTPTPSLSPTPNPTPNISPAQVTANVTSNPILNLNDPSYPRGDYLLINGTVTNTSPSIAYNVGLHISASAVVISSFQTVINVTIPIQSGTYYTDTNYNLTTLNPFESVTILARVYSNYQSEEPNLQGAIVSPIWSNIT